MKRWIDEHFNQICEACMVACMVALVVLLWVYTIACLLEAGA